MTDAKPILRYVGPVSPRKVLECHLLKVGKKLRILEDYAGVYLHTDPTGSWDSVWAGITELRAQVSECIDKLKQED